MRLFWVGVESTNLAHSECNVGATVAGQVEEHSHYRGIVPRVAHGGTVRVGAKGLLGAGKKVGPAVLESCCRNNLVNQSALGQAILILVRLFKLDAKELRKASFSGKLETLVLQGLDQVVDVLGIFCGNSTVIDIENDHDFVSEQEARVEGRLLEAEVLEGLAHVIKPEDGSHSESVQTLYQSETGVWTLGRAKTTGQMDPHRFLELGLNKGGAEVDRHSLPVEDQRQGEKQTNGWPGNDWSIRALLFLLKVASHTVSSFVLLYLSIWCALAAEGPGTREDLGHCVAVGDFDPGSLLNQGADLNLRGFNPLGAVVRPHCFIVGQRVGVLDSPGLVAEAWMGWASGVEVVSEEGEVAMALCSVEAEASGSSAGSTRAARWGRRGCGFLPLNRRCGQRRFMLWSRRRSRVWW